MVNAVDMGDAACSMLRQASIDSAWWWEGWYKEIKSWTNSKHKKNNKRSKLQYAQTDRQNTQWITRIEGNDWLEYSH